MVDTAHRQRAVLDEAQRRDLVQGAVRYLERSEPSDEIYLTLFQHGTEGVGLTPIWEWRRLLRHARRRGEFLGIHPEEHPRDFGGLGRYQNAVQEIPARYPMPSPLPLKVGWHGLD